MSLDVYILKPNQEHAKWERRRTESLVEAEEMKGLTPLVEQYYADREPQKMDELYWSNITHYLANMAEEAGIYMHLWRPEEIGITKAGDLIQPLTIGLERMKSNPAHYKAFNPKNGWGNYTGFVNWIEKYLEACKQNPDGIISVSR